MTVLPATDPKATDTATAGADLTGWTIAFDLDGTLIDTAPDLIATANAILTQNGFAAVPAEVLRPQISFGSRVMLETGLAHQRVEIAPDGDSQSVTTVQMDAMFAAFLTHYRANIAAHSRPFDGLSTTLARLQSRGATLCVCTNKLEEPARELLTVLELAPRFAFIAGRDTFPVCKPDPGHLVSAIEAAGGHREQAVMVGDSDVDVATAKAARIPVIGVTFGYTPVPVTDLNCDAVISAYDAFETALDHIIGRR